jgi:FeS assembly SUF system protein
MSDIPAHIRGDAAGKEPVKPAASGGAMRIFDSAKKKEIPASPTVETGMLGKIIDAIKTVYDPEIPVNLYDLGLIYLIDYKPESGIVMIDMTLTSPNCPVADSLPNAVREVVRGVEGVAHCAVKLVWEPKWSRDKMSDEALLALGLI